MAELATSLWHWRLEVGSWGGRSAGGRQPTDVICQTQTLAAPAAEATECLGLVVIFFLANFVVGTALSLGLRGFTGRFVSVYVNDATLAILSLLQALVFRRWRGRPK